MVKRPDRLRADVRIHEVLIDTHVLQPCGHVSVDGARSLDARSECIARHDRAEFLHQETP